MPTTRTTHRMTAVAFSAFAAATTLVSMSEAHAQSAPLAEPVDVVKAAPATPAAGATAADPNIDRGFLLPTAMTQPAGSVTYNNYELLLHGVSYGVTDRVQVSATVLAPIVRDMPFVGFAAVKGRVVSTDRFQLALQGSLGWGHDFDDNGTDDNIVSVGGGVFASYCLRQDCSSLVSASATYQLLAPDSSASNRHLVIYGGSVVHRVGRHVKLLGEVTSAVGGRGSSNLENFDGALVGYGVRFHSNAIAADVGFLKPVTGDPGDDEFLVGLPFINVSYRWQ